MSEPMKRGRGVKIALALSLAVNLAVAGLVGGAMLGQGMRGDGGMSDLRALGLGPFVRALPREDRRDLRERVTAAGIDMRAERRAIGQSLRDLEAALRTENFDRNRADRAFATSRASVVSLQEAGHAALLDQIESMDTGDRRALADTLSEIMQRRGRQP